MQKEFITFIVNRLGSIHIDKNFITMNVPGLPISWARLFVTCPKVASCEYLIRLLFNMFLMRTWDFYL